MDANANKNHKSSVFSFLFGQPEILRELYSAITGVEIPLDKTININTLSDVLFMKQINDLSFTIDDKIVVLIEHQSTINDNVPVRLLMYIARVYEKMLDRNLLYRKKLVQIPTPEFFVLYNGEAKFPDHKELRLSTAFKNIEEFKLLDNFKLPLELIVHVYNINHGRNPEMLAKSKTLDSYSIFIKKVNEFKKKFSLDESLKNAIKYCIENDILSQFLREHGSEVINMLTDELTMEEIIAIRCEDACEEAREEGMEKGIAEGMEKGRKYFLELLDQGITIEEIKQRLNKTS